MKAYSLVLVVVLGLSSCLRVDSQTPNASWRDILSAAHEAIIGAPLKFFRFFFPKPKRLYPELFRVYYVHKYEGEDNIVYTNKGAAAPPPLDENFFFTEGRLQSRKEVDKLLRVIRMSYSDKKKHDERLNALFTKPALKDQKNENLKHTYKLDRRWMVVVDGFEKREKHVQLFSFIASGSTVTVVCGEEKATVKRGFLWGVPGRFLREIRRQKPVQPFVIETGDVGGGRCDVQVYALDSHNLQLSREKVQLLMKLGTTGAVSEELLGNLLSSPNL